MTRPRDRIRVSPLDSDILWIPALPGIPRSMKPLGLLHLEGGQRPDAVLVSIKATGVLAGWRSGSITNLDQRKARAALDAMLANPRNSDEAKAELAAALKEWRGAAGMTQARAAEVLGMSKRSYEGVEAGRGFVYPQLLMLALRAFD